MNNIFALEAFKFGFKAFLKNYRFLFLALLTSVLIFIGGVLASALAAFLFFIPSFADLGYIAIKIDYVAGKFSIGATGPITLAFAVLGIVVFFLLIFAFVVMLTIGWSKLALNIVNNRENKLSVLFVRPFTVIKAFCVNSIVFLLIIAPWVATAFVFRANTFLGGIFIGLSLILTIGLGFKFAYWMWFFIDKNTGIIESIKSSFKLKGGARNIIALFVLSIPVGILLMLTRNAIAGTTLFGLKLVLVLLSIILQYTYSIVAFISLGYLYRALTMHSEQK